jgi:hypothetical protein
MNMVMTILEAHVAPEKWAALEQSFKTASEQLPPQISLSFLVQGSADQNMWRLVTLWHSPEALEDYRQSVETAGGVLMFRAVEVEPTLSIFDVRVEASGVAATD